MSGGWRPPNSFTRFVTVTKRFLIHLITSTRKNTNTMSYRYTRHHALLGSALATATTVAAAALLTAGVATAAPDASSDSRSDSSPTQPQSPGSIPSSVHSLCTNINWVGDSTSIDLITEGAGVVKPGDQLADAVLPKALFASGVKEIHYDISGGRSVVEKVNGNPNAAEALTSLVSSNPSADCNVYAGGTNDAADIAVGSGTNAMSRLATLAQISGKTPLLVTTVAIGETATATGYTPAAADVWNGALFVGLDRANIIDWFAHVGPSDFQEDGIHYTEVGAQNRAALITAVLAGDTKAQGKTLSPVFGRATANTDDPTKHNADDDDRMDGGTDGANNSSAAPSQPGTGGPGDSGSSGDSSSAEQSITPTP